MLESEITVQVFGSLKSVQAKLEEQGFKMIEKYTLHDFYYSKFSKQEVLKMDFVSLLNSSILIREIDEGKKTFFVMHKKKVLDKKGNVVSEQKTKAQVKNLDIKDVFERVGLNRWSEIKNTSYVYQKGEIVFCLQVVKDLGIFIEYEQDDYILSLKEKNKLKAMRDIVASFGLKLGTDFSCKKQFMMLHNNLGGKDERI